MHESPAGPAPVPWWTRAVLAAALVAVLGAVAFFGDPRWLTPSHLQGWVDDAGWWGPLLFVALFVGGALVLLPGTLVAVVAALVFPLGWALLLAWSATVLGGIVCFVVARSVGRDVVERRLRPHIERLDDQIGVHGLRIVLLLRLVGMPPINIMNYAAGLTKVRFRDYLVGTMIGVLPWLVAVVTIVSRLGRAPSVKEVVSDPVLWGAFALVGAVAWVAHRLRPRAERIVHEDDGPGP